MMGPNPAFMNASKLTPQELTLLNSFNLSFTMNMQDFSIQDRINRAVRELSKLTATEDKDRLAFSSDSTYQDLRRIISTKILGNKDLLNLPVMSMLSPAFPIMPGGGPLPIIPAGAQLPTLPLQIPRGVQEQPQVSHR
jgi:hypothetical protein